MFAIYLFIRRNLQEISLNLFVVKFRIPHSSLIEWLETWMLTKAQKEAIQLEKRDFELLQFMGRKTTGTRKQRNNPWRFITTLERRWDTEEERLFLETRLKYYKARKILESMLASNKKTLLSLTDYGREVLEACSYLNAKYPEMFKISN